MPGVGPSERISKREISVTAGVCHVAFPAAGVSISPGCGTGFNWGSCIGWTLIEECFWMDLRIKIRNRVGIKDRVSGGQEDHFSACFSAYRSSACRWKGMLG